MKKLLIGLSVTLISLATHAEVTEFSFSTKCSGLGTNLLCSGYYACNRDLIAGVAGDTKKMQVLDITSKRGLDEHYDSGFVRTYTCTVKANFLD